MIQLNMQTTNELKSFFKVEVIRYNDNKNSTICHRCSRTNPNSDTNTKNNNSNNDDNIEDTGM